MKKSISILIAVFALAVAMPSQAQVKFGVKGGLNLAKADFNKSDFKTDNFTGFFIGPMIDVRIPIVGIGVDGALLYSQRGVKIENKTEKDNGIEIPINLKYSVGLGDMVAVYFAAGPSFFYSFKDDFDSYKVKSSQLGINLGAGLKLLNHLQVGANYHIPVTKTAESKESGADKYSFKTKMWQVSVAYIF